MNSEIYGNKGLALEGLFGPSPGPAWGRREEEEDNEEEEDDDEDEDEDDHDDDDHHHHDDDTDRPPMRALTSIRWPINSHPPKNPFHSMAKTIPERPSAVPASLQKGMPARGRKSARGHKESLRNRYQIRDR